MAHGKTLLMRNIRTPQPQWVHQHTTPSRRLKATLRLKLADLTAPPCEPYVNPERDLKRARAGRKNHPKPKPQKPKRPKGGSKDG